MSESGNVLLGAIALVVLLFLGLFAGLMHADYRKGQVELECIRAGFEVVGGSCIRRAKP
jgi:hypothetical protein